MPRAFPPVRFLRLARPLPLYSVPCSQQFCCVACLSLSPRLAPYICPCSVGQPTDSSTTPSSPGCCCCFVIHGSSQSNYDRLNRNTNHPEYNHLDRGAGANGSGVDYQAPAEYDHLDRSANLPQYNHLNGGAGGSGVDYQAPAEYDHLNRNGAGGSDLHEVAQSNYDHLAGSTPPGTAPNNYDRLGPRGEANADGYYETAAIAGVEAPVYHTTQRAAEPASGRCAFFPRAKRPAGRPSTPQPMCDLLHHSHSGFFNLPHAVCVKHLTCRPHCVWTSRYVQPVTYAVPAAMDDGSSNSGYETMASRRGGPPPLAFESHGAYAVPVAAEGGGVEFAGLQANTAYESAVVGGGAVRGTPSPRGPAPVLLPPPEVLGAH